MKNLKFCSLLIVFMFFLIIIAVSCKKEKNNNNIVVPSGAVADIDGNIYYFDTVGTIIFMKQDLRVKHFSNGDKIYDGNLAAEIPNVTDNTAWGALTTPGWCYYNNDPNNRAVYGILYNWWAACDNRKVCPVGWHVPSNAEWTAFSNSLGGDAVSGGKMKEAGTAHWQAPNTGATNESGFTGLPIGARNYNGSSFDNIGTSGAWWSTTMSSGLGPYYFCLETMYASVNRGGTFVNSGLGIRCFKDSIR